MPARSTLLQYLAGLLIALTLVSVIFVARGRGQQETIIRFEAVPEGQTVTVAVGGAVVRPGVYTLPHGERVDAAIAAAGGFSEVACRSGRAQPCKGFRSNS